MSNLKKEIERIKSLFNEERLYGNTLNETCDNEDEAIELLTDKGYSIYDLNASSAEQKEMCKNPSDKLDCVSKLLRDNNIKYSQFDHEGKCVITVDNDKGGVEKKYMFVNKDNEYAFSQSSKTPFPLKKLDPTKKYKSLEFRGTFLCTEDSIEVEYSYDRYIEEGSTSWVKSKDNTKYKTNVSLNKIQK